MRFLDPGKSRIRALPFAKSLLDFLLASVCLLICEPLLALIALAIKIDSPGPVFSDQEWIDENGRIVNLLRFRSVEVGELGPTSPPPGRSGRRLTRVGEVIVRLRIDEIPQLINVVQGEVSFVDPRPMRPYFMSHAKKGIRMPGFQNGGHQGDRHRIEEEFREV